MNMFTWLIFAAVGATVISLATGIVSMTSNGEIGRFGSADWMNWRVGFQALAVVMVLLALQAPH
jgi:hypothetical protein